MPTLGVNIDHAATLRQARYRDDPFHFLAEPSPLAAARVAESAGARGITAHLREDRRHIQDRDIRELRASISTKLNLEMGLAPDIVRVALEIVPDDVCLVPENRQEVTTEGGLDCLTHRVRLAPVVAQCREIGIRVSLFIAPDLDQVNAAAELGADFVELHTGAFANSCGDDSQRELDRLTSAAAHAASQGLRVNAGHGLNYKNVTTILDLPGLEELNIGHAILSRSIFVGLHSAVAEMVALVAGSPSA